MNKEGKTMKELRNEKLNMVVGGSVLETAGDSEALYEAGYIKEPYNVYQMAIGWLKFSDDVDTAWKRAGIRSVTKYFKDNQYYKDGKEISRQEALSRI